MNLKKAIDRGLEIRQQMDLLKKELSLIEDTISLAARQGEQIDLEDQKRDGKQFLAEGTDCYVPVVLTADIIQASFVEDSDAHRKLGSIAKDKLPEFYKPVTTWKSIHKSGKLFRAKAFELLGCDAPSFITAATATDKNGIPKSSIKIEWERVTEVSE